MSPPFAGDGLLGYDGDAAILELHIGNTVKEGFRVNAPAIVDHNVAGIRLGRQTNYGTKGRKPEVLSGYTEQTVHGQDRLRQDGVREAKGVSSLL